MRIALVSIVLAFFLAVQLQQSSSAVIGIDFGSQWYKIALIRSGFFDIILNEQSNRKTPNMVGWHQNDRFFGADALNLWSRNPTQSYSFINQVLGKTIDTSLFTEFKEFFPYTLVNDTGRGSVKVVYEANPNNESENASSGFDGTFLPEELVSMILKRAKDQAEKFLGSSVVDCVLTVPPFLTHFERQALIDAGSLAGLNVLALINDITSFALNFGFIRTFSPEPQNVMFIDIGASSTSASIVEFSTIPDPKASKSSTPKEITQVLIKSTAWNESVGGRAFDLRLVNHFKSHIKKSKPSVDVDDARITLKLMKEAQKMKEVLSANQQSTVSIGSLSGDYDFTLTVTRPQFEEMCADLFQSVSIPIQKILNELNLTKDDLANVEVVGGASRIPKVQQILRELVGRGESQELDRHLNGDEAAAMGAVFYAASLSSSFKVKDIRLKDISSYPISVVLTKEENENEVIPPQTPEVEETTEAENEKEEEESPNLGESTALFGRQNRLGSKKGMTFYTNNNFSLLLQYGDENLIPEGTPQSIAQYTVTGIPTIEKYNFTGRPKVHASFRLSLSGVVILEKVDAEITVLTYPKPTTPPKEKEKEKSSESEKTVSEEPNQSKEGTTESEGEKGEKEEEESSEKPTDSENTAETSETEKEEKQTESETESTNGEKEKATEPTKAPTPVKKVIRVPLKIETNYLGVKPLSKSEKDRSERILKSFDQLDKDKAELQKEKNALESYIYEVREKLDWSENIEASTPEEREKLSEALSSAQDWLFEVEGMEGKEGAMLSDFKTKNKDLKFQAEKIFFRVQEKKNLPEDIATFLESVNFAHKILSNITLVLNVTEEERDEVVREVDEISDWVKEKFKEQQSRLPFQDPILTTRDIARKSKEIEMQMKLITRKPKRKPITPKVETVESNTNEDKNESGEKNVNEGENSNNAENENENLGEAHIEEENILSKDETQKLHDHDEDEKKHDEL